VFTAATILFFHNRFTDPLQGVMALKNLAIMGGLLLAFAHSHMWAHYYSITRERKGELAARDAEKRARDAEIRAARAEGIVEGRDRDGTDTVITDTNVHSGWETRRRRWFDW
jgi:putative oxidoreductase